MVNSSIRAERITITVPFPKYNKGKYRYPTHSHKPRDSIQKSIIVKNYRHKSHGFNVLNKITVNISSMYLVIFRMLQIEVMGYIYVYEYQAFTKVTL